MQCKNRDSNQTDRFDVTRQAMAKRNARYVFVTSHSTARARLVMMRSLTKREPHSQPSWSQCINHTLCRHGFRSIDHIFSRRARACREHPRLAAFQTRKTWIGRDKPDHDADVLKCQPHPQRHTRARRGAPSDPRISLYLSPHAVHEIAGSKPGNGAESEKASIASSAVMVGTCSPVGFFRLESLNRRNSAEPGCYASTSFFRELPLRRGYSRRKVYAVCASLTAARA
jgi:hypothetical protein